MVTLFLAKENVSIKDIQSDQDQEFASTNQKDPQKYNEISIRCLTPSLHRKTSEEINM